MAFPSNPQTGQMHATHTQTWEWTGTAWVKRFGVEPSLSRTNPDEPSGRIGPNATAMGGMPVEIADINEYDLVQYRAGAWRNTGQENIVDGGHF